MQFIFIDEVECNQRNPKFYGIGAVIFNYYAYHKYKSAYLKEFKKLGWNHKIEFKGRYLFSNEGDKSVSIESRINFVKAILQETKSKSNSRIKFLFCYNNKGNSEKNHLYILWHIVNAIKPGGKGFKNLLGFFIDENKKIDRKKIVELINDYAKGTVFERPFFINSDNNLPGLITIDILNYLKSWVELCPSDRGQLNLFGSLKGRDKEKRETVNEILCNINSIKNIKYK